MNQSSTDTTKPSSGSALSTDSLLSTNTTSSTISPFDAAGPPQKDYSAAFSILQSRYGTGGHAVPSPKTKPSNKLKDRMTLTAGTTIQGGSSQVTLVSSESSSVSGSATATAANTPISSIAQSSKQTVKTGGIRTLFKGKGKGK